MNLQYIAAAGVIVGLAIVALMLWERDVPIPGMPYKVEVQADAKRGLTGDLDVAIGDWRVYRGFSIEPSSTLPPLIFEETYRVTLETPVDSTSVTFRLGLNSTKSVKLTAKMPDPPKGLIKITMYDMSGDPQDSDERTI